MSRGILLSIAVYSTNYTHCFWCRCLRMYVCHMAVLPLLCWNTSLILDQWSEASVARRAWASCQIIRLRVTHVSEMPGTFSPPPRVSDPNMHRGTCVTLVPWCMLGSLTSGFLWSWWPGKRSRCMRKPWFYVSGKRPIAEENGSMNHKNLLDTEDIMTLFNKI